MIVVALARCWANPRRIFSSVSVSTAEKQSSRINIGAMRTRPLASAARCFCPPESVTPRSPIKVLSPLGKSFKVDSSAARSALCLISSSERSGSSYEIFSAKLSANKKGSCSTIQTCLRRYARGNSSMGTPSIKICPWLGASSRTKSLSSVDLPLPTGPIIAVVSPGLISTLIWLSAG